MARYVLGIDTAGPVVGAATWADGGIIGMWSERIVRGADGVLLPAIDALLTEADARGHRLARVSVSTGPGGFTGLRVGVSTALGIAMARGVGVVAVSSLAARAALAPDEPRVLAMLDARKSRVYAGVFDTRGGMPRAMGDELDVAPECAMPAGAFVAVGEGALVYADAVGAAAGRVVPDAGASPAAEVARLGLQGQETAPDRIQLRYIRPPDATVPRQLAGVGSPETG